MVGRIVGEGGFEFVPHVLRHHGQIFLHLALAEVLLPPVGLQEETGVHRRDIDALIACKIHAGLEPDLLEREVCPGGHLCHGRQSRRPWKGMPLTPRAA